MLLSPVFALGILGISSICILSSVIIFDIYSINVSKPKSTNPRRRKHKLVNKLPILLYINMFSTLTLCISLFLRLWVAVSDEYCNMYRTLGLISQNTSRCTLFLILIFRLEISHSDHARFAPNKYHLYLLYSLVFIYWFPYIIIYIFELVLFTGWAKLDIDTGICVSSYSAGPALAAYLIDIMISIDTLYLFLRPLRNHIELLKNINYTEEEKSKRIHKFYRIIIKYALLVGLCILTSFCSYPIAFLMKTYGGFIGFVDGPINVICTLLLKSEHQKIYNILCKLCDKGCVVCCDDIKRKENEMQMAVNIKIEPVKSNTNTESEI